MSSSHLGRNKTAIASGLAALVLAAQLPVYSQTATTATLDRAVILVRHGEDLETKKGEPGYIGGWIKGDTKLHDNGAKPDAANSDWVTNYVPTWPKYALPANTKRVKYKDGVRGEKVLSDLTVEQHGLSVEGGDQAKYLGSEFDDLTTYLNVAPISRIITKDPSAQGATPNPFDTVYPYLKTFHGELLLISPEIDPSVDPIVDKGLAVMLTKYAESQDKAVAEGVPPLLDPATTGSTLICWDAEGIWGPNVKGQGRLWNPESLLAKMTNPEIAKHFKKSVEEEGGGVPNKAARLYAFIPRAKPQGYDCVEVDVIKDYDNLGNPAGRHLKVISIISLDDTGYLTKQFPLSKITNSSSSN